MIECGGTAAIVSRVVEDQVEIGGIVDPDRISGDYLEPVPESAIFDRILKTVHLDN